jgi:hypothetical protein
MRHAVLVGAILLSLAALSSSATVPLSSIVPDYMPGDLETAITPTPQKAELGDNAFAVGKVLVVLPDRYNAPDTLVVELKKLLGDDAVTVTTASQSKKLSADTEILVGRDPAMEDWVDAVHNGADDPMLMYGEAKSAGPDAYLLFSCAGSRGQGNLVVLRGNTPAADFWALATLRQMIFSKDGVDYIREGVVLDFPKFKYRGNKRPRQWEWRYKANYAWFSHFSTFPNKTERAAYHRGRSAWIHHGEPLRATDQDMDDLIAGYTDPERGRPVKGAKSCYQEGCREFVLKFDDTSWQLSDATRKKFWAGDETATYFKALYHFVTGMHGRIKALDRRNVVYFMPQPYWHNAFSQREYAESLLAHGPLPEDMGLSVCGPEVISWTIPTACLSDYRTLYGLKGKAQIYDNFGRGGEFFAYTGRDPDLYTEVECVFPERGTPVTRITVYDYLWNPEAYDPDRSLKLAVRELSAGDPQLYRTMWDFVSYYNEHRDFADYPPRDTIKRTLPEINRQMKSRFDRLAPQLGRSPLAQETNLKSEFWGPEAPRPTYEWGEYARLRRRLDFTPYMLAYGYREGRVVPAHGEITVDGRLDESAWKKAKPLPDFVCPAWGRKTAPESLDEFQLPTAESTSMRIIYSPTHLYLGAEFRYTEKPTVPNWAKDLWKGRRPGDQAPYAWRVPCFEILVDVTGKREHYYQLVSNVAHLWRAGHQRAYATEKTGGWWRPDWKFKFNLGDKQGTFEASIPLSDLTDQPPAKGTVWGFQAYRSKIGPFSMFSGVYDLVGGEHATRQFGRIVFE